MALKTWWLYGARGRKALFKEVRVKPAAKVLCVQCGQPIERLDDLVIRGLNYGSHPLHTACYARVKSRWIYRLSINFRGWPFWTFLLLINLLLILCLVVFPDSWQDLRWFFLIANIPQLLFRLLAYLSYELPLSPTRV
jgi:hypothetical protein